MESGLTVCPACGERAVWEDDGAANGQAGSRVCEECGAIVEDPVPQPQGSNGVFDGEGRSTTFVGRSGHSTGRRAMGARAHGSRPAFPSDSRAQGANRALTRLGALCKLPRSTVDQARALVERYTDRCQGRRMGQGLRFEHLALAALYTVSRVSHPATGTPPGCGGKEAGSQTMTLGARTVARPVTLREMSAAVGFSVYHVGREYGRLLRGLQLKVEPVDPVIHLDRVLAALKPAIVGQESGSLSKDQSIAIARTKVRATGILALSKEDSLTTGRQALALAGAAATVAATVERMRMTPAKGVLSNKDACALLGDVPLKALSARRKEILNSLVARLEVLPWGAGAVMAGSKEEDLCISLDRILIHSVAGAPTIGAPKSSMPDQLGTIFAKIEAADDETIVVSRASVNPKAFEVSKESRERRLAKVEQALQRLGHLEDMSPGPSAPKGRSMKKRKRDVSKVEDVVTEDPDASWDAPSNPGGNGDNDDEDALIERLLMEGVSVQAIVDGYFDSKDHIRPCPGWATGPGASSTLTEEDLPEEDLSQYITDVT